MTLAVQGDARALNDVIHLWGPRVRRFAGRLCPATEVLDAVQETLLVLASRIGTLRSVEALTSWTYQVVRRFCVRTFSLVRRETAVAKELGYLAPDPTNARPEQILLLNELARVLETLVPRDREILVLRDLEGLSIQDTAAALGIGPAAVKSRLHRARLALRSRMSDSPLARVLSRW